MEQSKHTPGEWKAVYNSEQFMGQAAIYGCDGDENGRVIAVMDTSDETDAANIDLVCAAPALLEENQKLRQALEGLVKNTDLGKLKITKDFSLINAHAYANKVLHETRIH